MSDSGSKQTRSKVSIALAGIGLGIGWLRVPFALVVTGFGIGWLAGLSVSPVVSIVLTTVTGSVATIIAALSGVNEEFLKPETQPNVLKRLLAGVTPAPWAWLVVGLMTGSSVGLWARTHNWFSPDPPPPSVLSLKDEIQQWVDLGLDQQDVVEKYFASRVNLPPPVIPAAPVNQPPSPKDSVLFATASQEECTAWRGLIAKGRYDDLATEVKSSTIKPFRELPVIITDTLKLTAIVTEVLCVDLQP